MSVKSSVAVDETRRRVAGELLEPLRGRRAGSAVLRSPVFAVGLIVALVAGFAIGKAVQAEAPPPRAAANVSAVPSHSHGGATGSDLAGTSLSGAGYTLVAESTTFQAGVAQPFTFRVVGPDRKPVTAFVLAQATKLHLIVVRHDLTGFAHLHPAMAGDGTWTIALTLPNAGIWRAYADFVVLGPTGQQVAVTLAVDLTVPGDYRPVALPEPARESPVGGFLVSYEGTPQVGATQPITMRVSVAGTPVADLQRYLGSYGHLVVLREGDLAYLHVHPEDQLVAGGVKFWFAPPSAGRFRAFFEFQAGGVVHAAEFTLQVV
jgi:hypothetical protein